MSSFKSDYNKLIEIEKKYKLNEFTINEEIVWPYFRNKIYGLIHQKYNRDTGSNNFLKKTYSAINKSNLASQINKQYDAIIFNFTRKEFDSEFDLYDDRTRLVKDNLIKQNLSYIEIDFNNELVFKNTDKKIKNCDDAFIIYFSHKPSFDFTAEKNIFSQISKEISEQLEIDFVAERYYIEIAKKIEIFHNYFHNIYATVKPKFIVVTSNYMANEYIIPAKKLNIPVIETQYAAITKLHNGYDYKGQFILSYPDVMLTWSDYFKKFEHFPSNLNEVSTIGFTKMERLNKINPDNKSNNKVLVISQNLMSKYIIEQAIQFSKCNEELDFIIRLHPNETMDTYLEKEIENIENINIGNEPLDIQLERCSYVIGLSSTVLFEACHLKKKVIVLDGYSADFMEDLVDRNLALKFKSYNLNDYDFDQTKYQEIFSEPRDYNFLKFEDRPNNCEINNQFSAYLEKQIENKITSKNLYDITNEYNHLQTITKPLVTIVIPCYNVEDTILRTLYSISKIEFPDIYKVIAYNDGSTDRTFEILNGFDKIKNYEVINSTESSGGPATGRMYGVHNTDTKYIHFFDAGDYLNSEVFVSGLCLSSNYDLVKFSTAVLYANSKTRFIINGTKEMLAKEEYIFKSPFVWNGFYKRDIIVNNNLNMRDGLAEDVNFNIKYITHIKSNININNDLVVYFKQDSVLSKDYSFENILKLSENNLSSLKLLIKYRKIYKKRTLSRFVEQNILQFMFYNTKINKLLSKYSDAQRQQLTDIYKQYNELIAKNTKRKNINVLDNNYLISNFLKSTLNIEENERKIIVKLHIVTEDWGELEIFLNNQRKDEIEIKNFKTNKIRCKVSDNFIKTNYILYSVIETNNYITEITNFRKCIYLKRHRKTKFNRLYLLKLKYRVFTLSYKVMKKIYYMS